MGDKEEYFTFYTPETAKETDDYLEFRKIHRERISENSYLIVKKFDLHLTVETMMTGKQFCALGKEGMLGHCY